MFGRKSTITDDVPDNDGKVTVSVRVKRQDRKERKVTTTIVEQSTGKTLFKAEHTDKSSNTDYFAKEKALDLVRAYCDKEDYIPDIVMDSVKDKPTFRTLNTRAR